MVGLLVLLLLSFSLHSTAVRPLQFVLYDISNCVNLKCEWRGVGEQCKSATAFQTARYGHYFDFINDDESDDDLLARIKLRHQLNTFTVVNNAELGEMCKRRRLWCNVTHETINQKAYEEFFELLLDPRVPKAIRTKFQC